MHGNEGELFRDFGAPGDAEMEFAFDCETILVHPAAAHATAQTDFLSQQTAT